MTQRRATELFHAVTDAPARAPWVYWPLSVLLIVGGFWQLDGYPLWAAVGLGVALLPGATGRVKELATALVPFLPAGWARKNGPAPPPDTSGPSGGIPPHP